MRATLLWPPILRSKYWEANQPRPHSQAGMRKVPRRMVTTQMKYAMRMRRRAKR